MQDEARSGERASPFLVNGLRHHGNTTGAIVMVATRSQVNEEARLLPSNIGCASTSALDYGSPPLRSVKPTGITWGEMTIARVGEAAQRPL
ncbi:MAG: hypothetical protein PVJ55_08625 [Anaerolineae bacterium]|jgi:hypothetical protein